MKTKVSDSSLDNYEALKMDGLSRQQTIVMQSIRHLVQLGCDDDGWVSRKQISNISPAVTGGIVLEPGSVSGRVNELVAAKRLEVDPRTSRCPVSGKPVHLVRIPPHRQTEAA